MGTRGRSHHRSSGRLCYARCLATSMKCITKYVCYRRHITASLVLSRPLDTTVSGPECPIEYPTLPLFSPLSPLLSLPLSPPLSLLLSLLETDSTGNTDPVSSPLLYSGSFPSLAARNSSRIQHGQARTSPCPTDLTGTGLDGV